jgi:prepilin-type N-terminal cleavage/methylation domain-containing protein
MRPPRVTRLNGFSLIELLVVLGIIGCLMGILLPALEKSRERANDLRCATNLTQIGSALLRYANDNHGYYPRTVHNPAAPVCAGTNPASDNPFGPGGPKANDVSAALFLLVRNQGLPIGIFADPYTDEMDAAPDPATDLMSRSNLTDVEKNLSYSYANPYPDAAATARGFRLNNIINAGYALAADKNPGTGAGKNSRNHEGRGQNVLYADFHVVWETATDVSLATFDAALN